MSKKALIILGLVIIAGAAFYTYKKTAKAPTLENQAGGQQENKTPAPAAGASADSQSAATSSQPTPSPKTNSGGGTFSGGEGEPTGPSIQVAEIDYTDQGFTPASANIKVNDWVFFKNQSSSDFWVASNPHPVHTDYPEFDAKQSVAPGGTYKFQFTKAGSWGFHNHLNPSQGGTVNVN